MSIKLRSVSKSYSKKEVLNRLSFEISDSDFLVLKGNEGAGKSTLLKIICGVERASSGTITISGYDTSNMKKSEKNDLYRKMFGFISGDFYLQENLSVKENISLPGVFSNVPKRELESRVKTITKNLKLGHILKSRPSKLSTEQKVRACIARACIFNPKVIIADEPTKNLEKDIAEILLSMIKNYAKATGATVVVASNDKLVEKYATKMMVLANGKISEEKK